MRILVVTNCYPNAKQRSSGTFIEQQVKGLRQAGLRVEVLLIDRASLGYRAYLSLGPRVRAASDCTQADLIHVMYGGVMAKAIAKSVKNRPVIVSFCGSDLLGEPLCGLIRKMAVAYGVWCSRIAARLASGIVVKSQNLLMALPKGIEERRITILPNGVDLQRFKPLDPIACRKHIGWSSDGFHILFPANNNSPVKRYALAEAAVRAAKMNGIPAKLHSLRGVPHEEVPYWLNAADCLILTSKHEGSPNIVKEALACNRPVVSVAVGDVAERVAGIEGCYLAIAEPVALSRCLEKVYKTPQSVNGRQHVMELSLENVSQKLIGFYSGILKRFV